MKPIRIAYIIVTLLAVTAVFKYARMAGGEAVAAPTAAVELPSDSSQEEEALPVVYPIPTLKPTEPSQQQSEEPDRDEPTESETWPLTLQFENPNAPRPVRPSPKPRPSPLPTYEGEVPRVLSKVDFDGDGIDDYTDILLGAKAEAERFPFYYNSVYEGGYPPDDVGVCTDLVWRAFRDAGYNLKEMLGRDIGLYPDEYLLWPGDYFTPELDFRRVARQEIFFTRYCVPLTLDTSLIEEWQPGDIVIYDGHIGIVSDIRRPDGLPYLIHNTDELLTGYMEEDALDSRKIFGHYRFDASIIPEEVLIPWGATEITDNTATPENDEITEDTEIDENIDGADSADTTDSTDNSDSGEIAEISADTENTESNESAESADTASD